ncbi:MAG: YfiR family protein [Burkholderiales bacterium]
MRARAWTLLALLCAAQCPALAQQELTSTEVRIKAAFLYKFSDFIEWPPASFARADSPFVIGVMGADALADELAQVVANRHVGARPVEVRKLRRGASLAGLQVLFVGGRVAEHVAGILAAAKGHSTLTVTESEDEQAPGSIINFVLVDDKVRFDVALPAAEAVKLRISARLLAVARKVVAGTS